MKQLEAGEVTLSKVFSADYDFVIPDYQRPYAWGKDQAGELLGDVQEALERDPHEPYFLGSIVLIKEKGVARADVIDGQQRLTTLTILLAVLRDLEADDEVRTQLAGMVREPGSKLDGLKPKPRLTLRHKDAAFFSAHVQEPGAAPSAGALSDHALDTDAQKNIRDNAQLLHDLLRGWPAEKRHALATLLRNRVYLVLVQTPDLDSAHRIFAVMNDRGLALEPSDIFKSKVIGDLPDEVRATYAAQWEEVEQELGRQNFVDLFQHTRLIISKERPRKNLLREYQEQVLDTYLPGRAAAFTDDLLFPYASAYDRLLRRDLGAGPEWAPVRTWLRRLSEIDNNDWRPPALWALVNHPDDPQFLNDFFARLERLAAVLFVNRLYATPRIQRYITLVTELDQGAGLLAPAFDLTDEEMTRALHRLEGEVYESGRTRRYILLRLDETLANNPGVTYEHEIISVEHVLPQNPPEHSEWTQWFSQEEREFWTHRLANLVLLNKWKNSEARNFDFEKKKHAYFHSRSGSSTFALTGEVISTPVWTPDVLQKRQDKLVWILAQVWDLHAGVEF